LTYRLPAERSSARVSVWREVRRSGALQLHQSVIAFPDSEPFRHTVARIRAAVDEVGGTTLQGHARRMAQKATGNSVGRVDHPQGTQTSSSPTSDHGLLDRPGSAQPRESTRLRRPQSGNRPSVTASGETRCGTTSL
jgi:hypothetical protein